MLLLLAVLAAPDTPHARLALVAEETHVVPGGSVTLGIHFALEPGWHIYWHDPGESGEPPSVRWGLPEGLEVGELAWPAPKRLVTGPITNMVYEGEVLLAAVARAGPLEPGAHPLVLAAEVRYLVCKEDCIPGKARLALSLPVKRAPAAMDAKTGPLFAAHRRKRPAPGPATARPRVVAAAAAGWRAWSIETQEQARGAGNPVFVSFTADWCVSCKVNERLVLSLPEVRDAFAARGVVALEADWTDEDERVGAALRAFGRDGVPLYVLYLPGAEPSVLPPVLSREILINALAERKKP